MYQCVCFHRHNIVVLPTVKFRKYTLKQPDSPLPILRVHMRTSGIVIVHIIFYLNCVAQYTRTSFNSTVQ